MRRADVYVHASRSEAENFPVSILEALACGLPVVATAVGGIPEQVNDVSLGPQRATGLLTPAADAEAMANAIVKVLRDPSLRAQLAENACREVEARFSLTRQAKAYLDWFEEILDNWRTPDNTTGSGVSDRLEERARSVAAAKY